MPDPLAQSQASTAFAELSALDEALDQGFKPKTDERRAEVKKAVQTLAQQALVGVRLVPGEAIKNIEAIIRTIDEKLSAQVNKIMHHQDFRSLEGSWRGLSYLIKNTETDQKLKIRVLNISKKDLGKTLRKFEGTLWDQSPLFKKLYEEEFGTPGGTPYGCIVGDYHFDHTAPDVAILQGMAKIAAAAHAPFIAGGSPSTLQMDSWQELGNPRDIAKIFSSPEYAPWNAFRKSDDARYIALAMPRFLSRLPYGPKTDPVEEFDFREDTDGTDHNKYVWSNSAYAMATNITRSFKMHGWCARIRGAESGGMLENLPCHTFPTDDGGADMKCPTEISITDRREKELADAGFMPLSHWKGTNYAVFVGAQSLQKPTEYEDKDATANANLAARLPYLFAVCRFAHYLKVMVRDKIGSFMEREDMERYLHNWIMRYVADDATASEERKLEAPLRKAEVAVQEDPENPGYYKAQFWLRPHYQLEGLSTSLRLVSKLPSDRKS